MENMKNLYEVRKSLRFELKPSKITEINLNNQKIYENPINILYKNKIEEGNNYSRQIFEDNLKDFLEKIKNIYLNLEKIKNFIDNLKFNEIFIDRKIFEIIDKNYFIKSVKRKLSGGRSSNFYEIKKNLDWEGINLIKNYYFNNLKQINNLIIDIENIGEKETSFSKNEIKKVLRKISLEFIRVYNFLNFFDIKHTSINIQLKEYIEKIISFESFFEEIKSYYFISENQSSGILVRRFGFNEKSLKRRQPKEIKDNLNIKKKEFDEKDILKIGTEEERQKIIEEFDIKLKTEKFSDLLHPEKWDFLRKKEIKTEKEKEYLGKINNNFKELKELRNNNKEIKGITDKLNKYKKDVGNLKVDINNLEKELENNLALTHYSKLIEREIDGEKLYYGVLIPIENKDLLEQYIGNTGDTNIMEYNSLTFNAFEKLALSYDGTIGIYWDKEDQLIKKTTLRKWIVDFYKEFKNGKKQENFYKFKRYILNLIQTYEDIFGNINFDFKKLGKINNLDDYIKEFNKQGYNISWNKINYNFLNKIEKQGKIELYQIYTKDFYKDPDFFDIQYSIQEQKEERTIRRKTKNVNGNKNLFTIYWKNLIQNINNGNGNITLNSDSGYYIKLADKNLDKHDKGKSRKKRNKIIGTFNLSFNSNKSLTKDYDEKENIKEFNKIYKKNISNNIDNLTFIGLDRGVKELLTYCLLDNNGNCLKSEKGKYLIGNFNYLNNKGDFIKKEDCYFGIFNEKDNNYRILKNNKGKKQTFIEGQFSDFLKSLSYSEDDSDKSLKGFEKNINGEYEKIGTGGIKFILTFGKERYKILNKDGKEVFIIDKYGNKVIDYTLLLKAEWYKRKLLNKKNEIKLEDIQELRGGYISQIIKQLNKWIIKYNGVLVLENLGKFDKIKKETIGLDSNKEDELQKKFGITIYQEIETLLNRKYNYFTLKDNNKVSLQLTPKVKNIGDIKKIEKSGTNVNLGNIVFVDENLTSQACPSCNQNLLEIIKGKIIDKKEIFKLYGHQINKYENLMHHVEGDEKYKAGIIDGEICNFKIGSEEHKEFNFIKSGDDLASYNIAKKGLEYIKNLK